ncbi:hypothetical protein GUITHDRAFT_70862 [Guillardia theta CCMP2712]|uniref:Uncharacterized protein n=1 Tax=Guillardia theta (strain CCMP2712) TaxID=905079 RepID=L1JBS5_GUITC|nr:hypothetical protein GUITHDRAFT_70862 [Guillardia theta CCMP2712]EKX45966.1 hypothetical protein GUITHDRAFT_70862 [Guillardia theta CCMP2712]|eukprot:XP_005832946.1 hypothetical protein GUITHDRAFT_70862 [Guillardia theta CCMP2712]
MSSALAADAEGACTSERKDRTPGLPAVGESDGTLEVGGRLSLQDRLGPLVINEDGSMRRISDWSEKTEREREAILRVLGRRNKSRLEKLKKLKADLVAGAKQMEFIPTVVEEDMLADTMIDLQLLYEDLRRVLTSSHAVA